MEFKLSPHRWLYEVLLGILIVALGVFLIVMRTEIIRILSIITGVGLVFNAISNIVLYKEYKNEIFSDFLIIHLILMFALGIVAIVAPIAFISSMWRMFLFIAGTILIVNALVSIAEFINFILHDIKEFRILFAGLIYIVIGILFLTYPNQIGAILFTIMGSVVILIGIMFIILSARNRYIFKNLE